MSERVWTEQQTHSFSAHGGTLLVSAAAGSGKTAVLVERVIRMITHPTHPVDVDRLLIVTFTRAAAAEMRQRLSDALSEKMAKEPDNPVYLRQQMLLPRAYISTIHGFCARLLQEFSAQAEVPFGFRVAEEGQVKLLKAEALDGALEESYRQKDPAFLALAGQLCSNKNDDGLREAVLSAYEFMQAQPFPERWLQQQVDAYSAVMPLERTQWMQPILAELDLGLERLGHYAHRAYEIAQSHDLEAYEDGLRLEWKRLLDLRDALPGMTYDQIQQRLITYKLEPLKRMTAADDTQAEGKELVKFLRDRKMKPRLEKLQDLLPCTEAECREDLAKLAPLAEALSHLVQAFTTRFVALKRQQKWLDYNDLEQTSLRLLVAEDGAPTPLAKEIAVRFTEIMVDEYQDTNAAQDALFGAISRGGQNLFMVGDVKQSIYGFRQAMPAIFTNRRDAYPAYDEASQQFPATITLGNNFRSRRQVTDTVNFLFRQLMGRRLGGVEYDQREALVPSATYPEADCVTEWLLLDKEETDDLSEVQAEARQIGRRIRELMAEMTVTERKGQRPLTYRDICILHRKRADMPVFFKELTRMGIPVAADKGERFLDTPEVSTALSLLRVIDNPLREVALAAVMLSPLYGFTPDEMAQIRIAAGKRTPLYAAVEQMAGDATRPDLAARLGAFLAQLRRFRTLAVSLPADRLLETVVRETDMEAVFSARSGGGQRVANLQQLDRVARGYDPGEYRGLSAFIRYVDRVEESGEDLSSGDPLQQEGVRLMTVPGSKGLEFPVVFVSRLSRQRSGNDSARPVLFHADTGIGMKLIDEEEGERHTPLPFTGVRTARRMDDAAEDLRVWYVALTRAREKLILVDSVKEPDKLLQKLEWELPDREPLLPDTILRTQTPGEILLTAALRHPDFRPLRQIPRAETLPGQEAWQVTLCPALEEDAAPDALPEPPVDTALAEELARRRDFVYPYAPLLGVPAKLAASQLSHQQMSRAYIAQSRPAFLQAEGLTAAQKGTAMHTVMQFADYGAASADLLAEIDRLTAAGFLTVQQATSLNLDRLAAFFAGPLYRRMTAAPRVWREYPFAVMVPAGSLDDTLPPEMAAEEVLVQGIADCVFQEGDGLVLVDYKTDRVKSGQELADRYCSQMRFYQQALQTVLGLPVKEMLLYSFALGDTVEVR